MFERLRERLGIAHFTVFEMSIGILAFGILCNLIGIWIAKDKASYSAGVWIGVVCALLGTIHMCRTLDVALQLNTAAASTKLVSGNIIRYLAYCVVMGVCILTGIANPIGVFLGLLGMKAGAYMEPLVHKILFPGEVSEARSLDEIEAEEKANEEVKDCLPDTEA